MKQTKEQRELNNYTRSKAPNSTWEQDYLQGEGSGVYTDELQFYKRLAKEDEEIAALYHEYNKSWYAMGGWDLKDREDSDRFNSRRFDIFHNSVRVSLDEAVKDLEKGKDIQT